MQGPIRIIFPLTVLLTWVLFGLALSGGAWTSTQWLMLGIAHVICAIVFVHFIYVFNYGYAVSVVVLSALLVALRPSLAAALVGGIAAVFGLRLLAFTYARYQAASYAATFAKQRETSDKLPVFVKGLLWIEVSWLMCFLGMPVYFIARAGTITGWVLGGAAVMMAGLVLETLADRQKQAAKDRNPGSFVDEGIYRSARHPNYFGEMVFQLGLIVAVLGSVQGGLEIAMATIAPAYIIVLMYYSGRSADRHQEERYGADPAYRAYHARTGCFVPGW